jgi:uncharacterized protein (DUF1501 family)
VDTLTRRKFLRASGVGGAGALAAGATTVSLHELFAAGSSRPLASDAHVLVLVTLYGGNDGLNTLVPYADPAYRAARPELAYADHDVLHLDSQLGLNPAMKGLKKLWDGHQLAIVRGVGYPKPDHSHFRSMDIWQTASPDRPVPTGWLGRWLDATGDDPLRAVSLDPVLPPLLAGEKAAGAALPVTGLKLPQGPLGAGFSGLAKPSAGEPPLRARAASAIADLYSVNTHLGPALAHAHDHATPTPSAGGTDDATRNNGASAGGQSALAAELDVVAACLEASVPTRVYSVSLGGFDTHADEKGTQSRLLGELDAAITGFFRRIGGTARGKQVVLATYSEFGRRVHANASQGTDHGTAGPVFVVGHPVRGGRFFGQQPSLTDLDNGDLRFHTDFRDVYATLLEDVLGADAGRILGDHQGRVGGLLA